MGSTSDNVSGLANQAAGKVKEGVGKATGDAKLETEGAAQDAKGKRTTYFIDPERHVIAKLEVVTGQRRDPFTGATLPETDTYVFSDNRFIEGAVTPFKIERYSNGSKTEEMQLTAVRYNTGLKDTDFHR